MLFVSARANTERVYDELMRKKNHLHKIMNIEGVTLVLHEMFLEDKARQDNNRIPIRH